MLISVLDAQKTPNDYEYLRVLKPKVNEYAFCGLNPPPISLVLSYGHRAREAAGLGHAGAVR